ncbi:hypothetical protein HWV62_16342 [Athelia sp. TMB]|nr:hypothetical protein HWV62_16342 [Athelia sp. TMB]
MASRHRPSHRHSAPIATPTSPTPIATNADPLPCLLSATAAPLCVGVLEATLLLAVVALFGAVVVDAADDDDETDVDVGVEELITLDVEVMVGLGKESDGLADATLQNCCESFSAALSSEGQVTEMQATMALGKVLLPLWSGTFISTAKGKRAGEERTFCRSSSRPLRWCSSILRSRFRGSWSLRADVRTPLKLGYCAELVDVADTEELALADECAVMDEPGTDAGGGTSDADPNAEPAPSRRDTCKTQRERLGEKYFMMITDGGKQI